MSLVLVIAKRKAARPLWAFRVSLHCFECLNCVLAFVPTILNGFSVASSPVPGALECTDHELPNYSTAHGSEAVDQATGRACLEWGAYRMH
mmetsp:Transcript_12681/g.21165  ORF Transcript_12681/g.21165 Transcript_12681/m.21165 type:complete len:91 (-) Transcript_12681:1225-1497(-)